MNEQFFEGRQIYLTAFDPDRDAEVESKWTLDPEYGRLITADPVRPLSPGQVKKKYEDMEEDAEKNRNAFNFAIRARVDQRLIGFVRLFDIAWTNGVGEVSLGLGDPSDRHRGYGREALQLIVQYAFDELNLQRLTAVTFEYNAAAIHFLERHGFTVEVRRRQAIARDGRRWDGVMLGLLRGEWKP